MGYLGMGQQWALKRSKKRMKTWTKLWKNDINWLWLVAPKQETCRLLSEITWSSGPSAFLPSNPVAATSGLWHVFQEFHCPWPAFRFLTCTWATVGFKDVEWKFMEKLGEIRMFVGMNIRKQEPAQVLLIHCESSGLWLSSPRQYLQTTGVWERVTVSIQFYTNWSLWGASFFCTHH